MDVFYAAVVAINVVGEQVFMITQQNFLMIIIL